MKKNILSRFTIGAIAGGVIFNALLTAAIAAPLKPENLRLEYLSEPLGIDVAHPRFSWELATANGDKNKSQTAYQITVSTSEKLGNVYRSEQIWSSRKITGDAGHQTNQITYTGPALKPFTGYMWTLRVWDEQNAVSTETTSFFTTGPMTLADWSPAIWIGEPEDGPGSKIGKSAYHDALPPSPYLRKEIKLATNKKIGTAYFYSSALGFYHLSLNGKKVGTRQLAPERSVYEKHLMFQTEEVTAQLHDAINDTAGAIVIGVELADGWYAGGLWSSSLRGANHGSIRKFIGKLQVNYTDGTKEIFVTDDSWQFLQEGPRSNVAIMGGETFDASKQQPGWDKPNYQPPANSDWKNATAYGAPDARTPLVSQLVEPIKIIREFQPVSITPVPDKPNTYIFDMGQNIAGWCHLTLPYNPGQKITLRHFEMPNPDGSIYTANLRGARPNDTYVPANEETISYEPRFTFHGFRYVQVEGLTQPPKPEHLTGVAITSGAPVAGEIVTDNKDINKLWENIRWSQWDNQISIPTDCPQRDEREGWMADAQVFAQNAIYNLDMAAFYTKWCRDIRDEQLLDGRFPDVVPIGARRTGEKYPDGKGPSGGWQGAGSPGWADAGVIVPWRVWENYGDKRILEQSFDSFKRWVNHLHKENPDLLWKRDRNNDFSDWLHGSTFRNPPDAYPRKGAEIPKEMFATAYFYYSAKLTAETARILGKPNDTDHYTKLAADIKNAFQKAYLQPDGKLLQNTKGDNQGAYAMALALDLIPKGLRANATNRLVNDLEYYDWRLSTGFHSTIWMMKQLSENGRSDAAYQLLLSRRFPGWIYSIDNGATTIWERWDGYVKGRGFQDAGMNSFNHYSLGAVGEWMYAYMLGIKFDPESPGWTHFYLAPNPPRWIDVKQAKTKTVDNAKPTTEPVISLTITKATYGVSNDAARQKDVTAILTKQIKDNKLRSTVTNQNLGGDPAYGFVKELKIEYVANGKKETLTLDEDDEIILPYDPNAKIGKTTGEFVPYLNAPADAPKSAQGHYRAITGDIKAAWNYSNDGKQFTYKVTVPANTTATVILPFSGKIQKIGSGTYEWTETVK